MKSDFVINSLEAAEFNHLYSKSSEELGKLGIESIVADEYPGYPCRVSLEDAAIGEELLLLTFEHHSRTTPYRSSGPIFIRKEPIAYQPEINRIPKMLSHRHLSLRAYDKNAMMVNACTIHGSELEDQIISLFADNSINYIHVHNAGPGCFNCEIQRA